MTKKAEIFISLDVEADGRVPGLSSMLSLGGAAYTLEKELVGTFSRNLEEMPDAHPEPDTMAFWAQNREAWNATRRDPVPPSVAMLDFVEWVNAMGRGRSRPVAICYPGAYDFKWVDYYTVRYMHGNPFGFNGCLDLKSYACAYLRCRLHEASKQSFPKDWFDEGLPHTHVAVDDAIEQGAMGINMIRAVRGLPPVKGIVRAEVPAATVHDIADVRDRKTRREDAGHFADIVALAKHIT